MTSAESPPHNEWRGVWLCYYADRSGFAVFDREIDALRYAVEHSMAVKFQEWGEVTL